MAFSILLSCQLGPGGSAFLFGQDACPEITRSCGPGFFRRLFKRSSSQPRGQNQAASIGTLDETYERELKRLAPGEHPQNARNDENLQFQSKLQGT